MLFRIILALVIFLIALGSCPNVAAQEQTMPSTIGYGAIVQDGAKPITVKALGFTKNLKTFTSPTQSTVLQVYWEQLQFAPSDYFVDGSNAVIATTPTVNVRLSKGSFGLALGLGGQYDFVAGDDNDQWTWLTGVRFDVALFRKYAGLSLGAANLESGRYAWYGGVTFDGVNVAETLWSWLTR